MFKLSVSHLPLTKSRCDRTPSQFHQSTQNHLCTARTLKDDREETDLKFPQEDEKEEKLRRRGGGKKEGVKSFSAFSENK